MFKYQFYSLGLQILCMLPCVFNNTKKKPNTKYTQTNKTKLQSILYNYALSVFFQFTYSYIYINKYIIFILSTMISFNRNYKAKTINYIWWEIGQRKKDEKINKWKWWKRVLTPLIYSTYSLIVICVNFWKDNILFEGFKK